MSTELVQRAIVREALGALDAAERLVPCAPSPSRLDRWSSRSSPGDVTIEERRARGRDRLAQTPCPRGRRGPSESRRPIRSGGLRSPRSKRRDAVAAPVADSITQFGVLIVAKVSGRFADDATESVRLYAAGAAAALSRSALVRATRAAQRRTGDRQRFTERTDRRHPRHRLRAVARFAHAADRRRHDDAPSTRRPVRSAAASLSTILEQSIRSNDELQRLAETLLLVSKYESGEGSRRRERVELRDVIARSDR